MNRRIVTCQQRPGFTLVEQLVVIGIIMVLAAILVPVLSRARDKAQQTTCLSNLRQLGMALTMYVDDHEGEFPYDVGPRQPVMPDSGPAYDGTNKWDASPIVGLLQDYIKSPEVAFCPTQQKKLPDVGPLTNYEFNGFIALNDSPQAPHDGPVCIQDVVNPSDVLTFEDYSDSARYHWGYRNFVMVDGSARTYPVDMQGAPPCHAKWWY